MADRGGRAGPEMTLPPLSEDVGAIKRFGKKMAAFPIKVLYLQHQAQILMIHTGQLIRHALREKGHTVTWFAAQLCCTRSNIYKIFRKNNIDVELLWRISLVLDRNFFFELSDLYRENPFLIDEE